MKNKYLRLMRFDKPAGIALLWAPTAWALWLANQGQPNGWLIAYFLFGTVCMRAAGCIINDIADRNIDKHVCRTQFRPVTSGEISIQQAGKLLFGLLVGAGLIVLQLPKQCWYEAIGALLITGLYPFAKRYFQAPQLLLGIAFSMGIPMAYTASNKQPDEAMMVLCVLNFLWIVAYDTMYALVDKEDDVAIGVRSTARLFGTWAQPIIMSLLGLVHALWLLLFWKLPLHFEFILAWLIGGGVVIYQCTLLRSRSTAHAMRAFLCSAVYGLVMWVGFI